MDVMAQDIDAASFTMPIRGVKRKVSLDYGASVKKARGVEGSFHSGRASMFTVVDCWLTHQSESDVSEHASSVASSDAEEEMTTQPTTQTPSTPLSSKPSPRYPSDLKNHVCSYDGCDKTFNRPAKLAQHIRSHNNERPFVCPHPPCTKDFLRDSHLKHHIKSAHSDVRDHVCEWEGCEKSFMTSTRLKRHHAAHEGRQKFMCTECAQSFRKHGTLQAHFTTAHEGKKRFMCAVQDDEGKECGKGFDTAGKLKTHEGRVHGGKRFWCSTCNPQGQAINPGSGEELAFSTYASLQEHIKIEHPPTCAECGLQCSTQGTLKSHVEVQHGALGVDERRTHACPGPGCERGFTKKGNLDTHLRLVHGDKSFVCGGVDLTTLKNIEDWNGQNACGRALSTKANLIEHIRTAHMGLDHSRKSKTKMKARVSKGGLSKQEEASAITRLTGSGYGKETGRNIACVLSNCDFRFFRDYDLEIHLEIAHGLPFHEAQLLMSERNNLAGVSTFEGSPVYATAEELEAERALDAQFEAGFGFAAMDKSFDDRAEEGGDFWLGGQSLEATNAEDDWQQDEMEMDQLIAGDHDRDYEEVGNSQDTAVLDPALR